FSFGTLRTDSRFERGGRPEAVFITLELTASTFEFLTSTSLHPGNMTLNPLVSDTLEIDEIDLDTRRIEFQSPRPDREGEEDVFQELVGIGAAAASTSAPLRLSSFDLT